MQGPNSPRSDPAVKISQAQAVLQKLLTTAIVPVEQWQALPATVREELTRLTDWQRLVDRLVEDRLLTPYQAERVRAGQLVGLVLGNYRILEQLGAGGMGVVYKAEHLRLRWPAAVKVVPVPAQESGDVLFRFEGEIHAVSQLRHPHIVAALDAGQVQSPDPTDPLLCYFAMEYVPGQDLDDLVRANGPLAPSRACTLTHQVASALAEAHRYHLVHRDVKPANVLVTPAGQAKLLDFGLVRNLSRRLTTQGSVLGSIDYLAPEQARDSAGVDIRADIYGLGGTLFWCLIGREPFAAHGPIHHELTRRQTQAPPSLRSYQPHLPAALDAVVRRMLACRPEDRFATPQAVMEALKPFLSPASG